MARATGARRQHETTSAPHGRLRARVESASLERALLLVMVVVALALRLWPLRGVSIDYQDEGVYWQSLRAMAAGWPLFSAIFSSQPPFFLLCLYPFYLLFGQTLVAARLAIALYSLLGFAATYYAGRAIGGRWGGLTACALLAADPLYLIESHTLQAEMPALAFATLGVALSLSAPRAAASARRRALAAASGAAVGLGIMSKLFDVVALVPTALYLAAPLGAALQDDGGRLRRVRGPALRVALRLAVPDLALLGLGVVVACAAVALPFLPVRNELYDQVVRFHQVAEHTFLNKGWRYNVGQIGQSLADSYALPYLALAFAACGLAAWRGAWTIVPLLLWLLAAVAFLIRQQPLLGHQMVLLAPPLALIAGLALPLALPDSARDRGHAGGWRAGRRSHAVTTPPPALTGAVMALVVAAALVGLVHESSDDRVATRPVASYQAREARALDTVTRPGDIVVTDNQFVAGLANRSVPPQLVDTSFVRIYTGGVVPRYLSAGQIEQIIMRDHVRVVLFGDWRFDLVPGFRHWVSRHFRRVAYFGSGRALYLARSGAY